VRVLYSFPDEIGRAGIGTTAYQQVHEVALQGVDVTLYCGSTRVAFPSNVKVLTTLSLAGRRIPHRALGVDRAYRYHDLRVARAVRRLGRSIDVVHCWPRATVHTCRAARAVGVPCLREVPNTHTAHAVEVVAREVETLGMTASRKAFSHVLSPKILALEEREYDEADILLVPSEYSRQTFVARGVPAGKLRLHRYGYDVDRFFTGSDDVPRPSHRPFTAIFVGRCEPRKGLHLALRAWLDSGAANGGRFIICGSFEPGYREAIEPLLAHPSIEVRGYVPDPAALMRESDVFCFPSIEEGSALVTYEARACGCVLVVSEAAGARSEHGVTGLVHEPGDVAALTRDLRALYEDPALVERLRSAALERAEDLSWRAAAEELVAVYRAAAAGEAALD
jgi:glycosyltransferase involved in cell wall biosynthesis